MQQNSRLRVGEPHNSDFHHKFAAGKSLDVELELYGYRGEDPPLFFKSEGRFDCSINDAFLI